MSLKDAVIGFVAVVALVLGGLGLFRPEAERPLGAVSGPEIYSNINIHGTLTQGDGTAVATSTTATSYTLVLQDLQAVSLIDLMINRGPTSFTLPATSTMINLLQGVGSSRSWLIHNATSSVSQTLTLVTGAGMDLVGVSNATDVIDPGEWTELTCTQIPYRAADNENIICVVTELENSE